MQNLQQKEQIDGKSDGARCTLQFIFLLKCCSLGLPFHFLVLELNKRNQHEGHNCRKNSLVTAQEEFNEAESCHSYICDIATSFYTMVTKAIYKLLVLTNRFGWTKVCWTENKSVIDSMSHLEEQQLMLFKSDTDPDLLTSAN